MAGKLSRLLAMGLLGLVAGLSGGCLAAAGAGAGAAGVRYAQGDSEATLDVEPEQVMQAARSVYRQMDIAVSEQRRYGQQLELRGRTSADELVKVSAEPREEATKIWVRIGVLGDPALSAQVLRRVERELEDMAPAERTEPMESESQGQERGQEEQDG